MLVQALKTDATAATAAESTFTMTGGTISGNQSHSGGGVFMTGGEFDEDFYSKAHFTMSGGSITGNSANGEQVQYGYSKAAGGGVYLIYGSDFTMTGGEITNNTVNGGNGGGVATNDGFYAATNGRKVPYSVYDGYFVKGHDIGKWPEYFPAKFTMDGGVISGNTAKTTASIVGDGGCGGGIYIASAHNDIKKGSIENNVGERQGGGIYVGSIPFEITLYDTIVTQNTADIIGGGLWTCPTGDVYAYVNDGAAFYDNTAQGAADDVAAVKNNLATHHITISDRMLGGGPANWYRDGAIDNSFELGLADTSVPRYIAGSAANVPVSIPANSNGTFAIKGTPNEPSKQLAQTLATVRVSGNSSQRGGGIGSNGSIVIGKKYDEITATVKKAWDMSNAQGTIPAKITVWLTINGYKVESVELNAQNNWTHTFKNLPKDVKVTFTEDEVSGFSASYEIKYNDAAKTWEGTITNKAGDYKAPTTGDTSHIELWLTLALLSLAGLLTAVVLRRIKHKKSL